MGAPVQYSGWRAVSRDPATGQYKSSYSPGVIEASLDYYRDLTKESGAESVAAAIVKLSHQLAGWWGAPSWPKTIQDAQKKWVNLTIQLAWENSAVGFPLFVAHNGSAQARVVKTGKARMSYDIKGKIYDLKNQCKKGIAGRVQRAFAATKRNEIVDQAFKEGTPGYFQMFCTQYCRWKGSDATTREELEEEIKAQAESEKAYREEWEDDFWTMHREATKEYVEIRMPAFTDIIRIPGLFGSTDEEKKANKKQFLEHMLHSPIPKTAQKLQRIAKDIDDIEDYASTGTALAYLGTKAANKCSPWFAKKVGSKLIPGLGWALLAMDILNLGTAIFSMASNPMGAKRMIEVARSGTFRKGKVRLKAAERIKRWRPNIGTLLEALQASEDATGYGIRLGAAMGGLSEVFWAAEKYITGETKEIRILYAHEQPGTLEQKAYKAMGANAELLAVMKQVNPAFYCGLLLRANAAAKQEQEKSIYPDWDKIYEGVKHERLVYEPPTDPITREVLSEMGFDPDENVGYLGMDYGEMPTLEEVGFVSDENPAELTENALAQLKDSWQGYFYELEFGDFRDGFLGLLGYPDGGLEYIPAGYADMLMVAAKMSIIPPLKTPIERIQSFCDVLSERITLRGGRWPSKRDIESIASSTWGQWDNKCPPTRVFRPW